MPLRNFVIFISLVASTFGAVALCWLFEWETYAFMVTRRGIVEPPLHWSVSFAVLAICANILFFFHFHGVYLLTFVAASLTLGTVLGPAMFGWTPSPGQLLLNSTVVAAATYGWFQRDYLED